MPTPGLRQGFSDRVLHAVNPEESLKARKNGSRKPWAFIASLAAVLAISAVTLNFRLPSNSGISDEATTENTSIEETLIAALRSPELSSEDIALVANLGEIMEAELSATQSLWLYDN